LKQYLIPLILLGHGLIVAAQSLGSFGSIASRPANPAWLRWWPTRLGQSWFLAHFKLEGTLMDKIFGLLWLASGLCIIAAAWGMLGLIIPNALSSSLAIYGATASLILLLLYFHPFFIIGILVDVTVLVVLLQVK
jgi:hypothetical protein